MSRREEMRRNLRTYVEIMLTQGFVDWIVAFKETQRVEEMDGHSDIAVGCGVCLGRMQTLRPAAGHHQDPARRFAKSQERRQRAAKSRGRAAKGG